MGTPRTQSTSWSIQKSYWEKIGGLKEERGVYELGGGKLIYHSKVEQSAEFDAFCSIVIYTYGVFPNA